MFSSSKSVQSHKHKAKTSQLPSVDHCGVWIARNCCSPVQLEADRKTMRHTYVSAIVSGRASVKVAQTLARHSTPNLTIGRYAHAALHDQRAAVDALPSLVSKPAQETLAATGTDGKNLSHRLAQTLAHRLIKGRKVPWPVMKRTMDRTCQKPAK